MYDSQTKNGKIPFVGVMDSGVGGISVLDSLYRQIPYVDFRYFADSKHAPYGTKSVEEVQSLVLDIVGEMVSEGAIAIVLACNTATAAAVQLLRSRYRIPIIGMEPAIRPALHTAAKKIAVLATDMTLSQEKFHHLIRTLDAEDRILKVPAPFLVQIVESRFSAGEDVEDEVVAFIKDRIPEEVDTVVLGCTHFIFLKEIIGKHIPHVIDGNQGTALRLQTLLEEQYSFDKTRRGKVEISSSLPEQVERLQALFQKRRGGERCFGQTGKGEQAHARQ